MKILIVSQYFWPETFIINELAAEVQRLGHQVSVFTGKPNYPEGHIFDGYQQKFVHQEYFRDVIPVYRVPLRPRKSHSGKNLLLNYLSFVSSGIKHALKFAKQQKFDCIFAFGVSPITAAIPAIVMKRLTQAHLSIWVQDLWPESVHSTGYIKNPWLLTCVRHLVKWIYRAADMILVQSEAFIGPVRQLAEVNKIFYYANSAADMLYQGKQRHQLPDHIHDLFDNFFTIVFAGNIGTAQAIDTIIAAADLLTDLTDVRIVLVGNGSMLHVITEKQQQGQLCNVVVAGRYPYEAMPELFNKAQALLVTLRDEPIYRLTVPCKVQAYLSAGKPIIASLNGEGARVLAMTGAAIVCPAEDASALAIAIRRMRALDDVKRQQMAAAGREYFINHFEISKQAALLITMLKANLIQSKEPMQCVS